MSSPIAPTPSTTWPKPPKKSAPPSKPATSSDAMRRSPISAHSLRQRPRSSTSPSARSAIPSTMELPALSPKSSTSRNPPPTTWPKISTLPAIRFSTSAATRCTPSSSPTWSPPTRRRIACSSIASSSSSPTLSTAHRIATNPAAPGIDFETRESARAPAFSTSQPSFWPSGKKFVALQSNVAPVPGILETTGLFVAHYS